MIRIVRSRAGDLGPPSIFGRITIDSTQVCLQTIDRPICEPRDTNHILDEIDALAQLRGQPNIAQLVGLVVSENPYKTCPSTDMPALIIGFLLEYYPGGSLEQIIEEAEVQNGSLPLQWALQIGRALESLHKRGRSHLDVKPSNIVFDARKNAILIDISGTGGYMWEWLSPEMQMLIQQDCEIAPANASFEARIASDCWLMEDYSRLLPRKVALVQVKNCNQLLMI